MKKDGGQAFPTPETAEGYGNDGMTLRDYFAAQAMQAIFGGAGATQVADRDMRYDDTNWKEVVAANAYEMADAMIAEREKP